MTEEIIRTEKDSNTASLYDEGIHTNDTCTVEGIICYNTFESYVGRLYTNGIVTINRDCITENSATYGFGSDRDFLITDGKHYRKHSLKLWKWNL